MICDMKKDSLAIDGKIYLSSRRAAEIAGYSKDYIGQLCRSGKLVCRTVGRLWYVDEVSLRKHQAESFKANQTSFRSPNSEPVKNSRIVVPTGDQHSVLSAISEEPKLNAPIIMRPPFSKDKDHIFSFKGTFILLSASFVILVGVLSVLSTTGFVSSRKFSKSISDNSANVYSAITSISGILSSALDQAYTNIALVVTPSYHSVPSLAPLSVADEGEQSDSSGIAHAGLVVVPETGSSTNGNDAKLTQTITNSFSDNVTITPGPNGTTGVITPEFRTVKGHDFLYVLVPVKTASSSATSNGMPTAIQN